MSRLKEIQAPIADEMKAFETRFREAMKSKTPLLDKITHYIIKRKGKQMRPMFVFLAAKANGQINDATFTAASLIELLHTATLVHDDVVDDANRRRGMFSINALWKNKIAVLVGDYLLSKGLLLSVENEQFELLKIVSTAVKEISEGELLQIEKARKMDITEEVYFDIIRQKTASLIAACCQAGTASVSDDVALQEKMRLFGEYTGLAFQIKDDLFDYGTGDIGKPTGIDIKERKMTLPLIYALNQASKSDRKKIINTVKNHNEDPKRVQEVIDFVIQSEGLDYTTKEMHKYRDKALDILAQIGDNEGTQALASLVNYTIERKK